MREPADKSLLTDVSRLRSYRCTIIVSIISLEFVEGTACGAQSTAPRRECDRLDLLQPRAQAKRLEVFKDAYPSASRIAVLFNPDNPVDAYLVQAMELATKALKLELQLFK